jgi:hypothetical protein
VEVLRSVGATLRIPEYGEDAVSLSGEVKITITRDSDGSTLVTDSLTTHVAGEPEYWSYEVSGSYFADLDILTATWTDGDSTYTTQVEVVGGYVVSLASIKAKLGEDATDDELTRAREQALDDIERACHVSFRPRYRRERLSGNGTNRLLLGSRQPRRILSLEVEDSPLSEADIEALILEPSGVIVRDSTWPLGRSNIVATYEAGYEFYTPAQRPVRDLAAYYLTASPTDWNERATGYSNDYGTYSLVTPGVRGASFPLPVVNSFVEGFCLPLVG